MAAMPFPSRQGTQNAVREMCRASAEAGRDTHLFTYAAGVADDTPMPFTLHRASDFPRVRSLRSGPSLVKVALDLRMTVDLARLVRRIRPSVIVAHHVEAAAMVAALGRPFVFFAHTDMQAELPAYAPAPCSSVFARAGLTIDRRLARRAHAVAAISPVLASRMARLVPDASRVRFVPVSWSLPRATSDAERAGARTALGIAHGAPVVLYAGNLDAYQNWERVVEVVAIVARHTPHVRLVVGTASARAPLDAVLRRSGVWSRTLVHPIDDEAARRCLHAAADVAIVPRRAVGGLPVKLLDALARATPCVAAPTATAGLALGEAAQVARGGDAPALADALGELFGAPELRRRLGVAGRAYVAERHNDARFLDALDRVAALACDGPGVEACAADGRPAAQSAGMPHRSSTHNSPVLHVVSARHQQPAVPRSHA